MTITATEISTGTWALDPTHTEIGFTVRHLMSKVRGKFETFEGTVVTGDDVTDSRVDVSVDLSSINTGTADRDNHLRSSDFFEVETHPTMTFASTGVVEKAAGELVVQRRPDHQGRHQAARARGRGPRRGRRPVGRHPRGRRGHRRRSAARSSGSTSTSRSRATR